jgi:choline dehydrogenase-like flavoprotein
MTDTTGPAALDARRADALDAVCDTLMPALESPDPGPAGDLLRLGARKRGLTAALAAQIPTLRPHVRSVLERLLDELAAEGFGELALEQRTARLLAAGDDVPHGRFAVKQLKTMLYGMLLGAVDADGRNPVWEAIGFPGPTATPPSPEEAPKTLPITRVEGAEATLSADVCVVGSGAGGSVIAARLAQAGKSVIVLEAGQYYNESDFAPLDASGARMYLGGGLGWSEHGELGLLAGSALGGGTVINSLVSLRTPQAIREAWAELGLEGLDGEEFDRCTDLVWDRIGVNTEATKFNANTERMVAGLSALGYAHERLPRNASLDDDPAFCGACNNGCLRGCKRSTLKTYLEDAAAAGTRIVVGAQVERVLVQDGRAVGVEGVVAGADGPARLRVEAPTVVVACGGIESPALLLRSGIGGPAAGRHLRVHPAWLVTGVYDEPVEAWSGQIQSAASFDLTHCESDVGFLVESLTLSPGTWASQAPFTDGRAQREELFKLPFMASWHGVSHDHGSGEIVLDEHGDPLVRWSLNGDNVDHAVAARAHVELARLHRAAGAHEVFTFHYKPYRWREGEDFDAYLERLRAAPVEDYTAYSAHQMGSCRLGADPQQAVADGDGQLHDVGGVWIGDAAALPSAPGVNPMITIMALAERTATRILAADRQPVAAS